MDHIESELKKRKDRLRLSLSVDSLAAKNKSVYKWKAPFRCILLRETVAWRLLDLLTQSYVLHKQKHELGARILLRSALETLAILIYLNMLMRQVIDGKQDFHFLDEKTTQLLLGEKHNPRGPDALNIITVLDKCGKRYRNLTDVYADLSESAHPNFNGLLGGYSTSSSDMRETEFSSFWLVQHAINFGDLMDVITTTFDFEYNHVWGELFDKLEVWISENDEALVATMNHKSSGQLLVFTWSAPPFHKV